MIRILKGGINSLDYINQIRQLVGNIPLILVRPSVVVFNEDGQFLMVRYSNSEWCFPGGMMELGETPEGTAMREVFEETGLKVDHLKLSGVFSGEILFTKLDNGDQYYNVIICYITQSYSGTITINNSEIIDANFFSLKDIPSRISNISKCILNSSEFISSANLFTFKSSSYQQAKKGDVR